MTQSTDRRITLAILLSLLFHLVLLYFFTHPLVKTNVVSEELEVFLEKKQIADISPPEKEKRPEKARFLGLYDSLVQEEQVATAPYTSPSGRRIVTDSEGRELPKKDQEGEGAQYAAKMPDKGVMEERGEEDFGTVLPEDFFPNIRVGDRTYLNVLRYPAIGYFVRIKKIFKLTWSPWPALSQYFFTNQIVSAKVQTTVCFQIDRKGNLRRAFVCRSSGLPLYDEEAVRVVRDSAPFETPPRELLKLDGTNDGVLDISWGFIVYDS